MYKITILAAMALLMTITGNGLMAATPDQVGTFTGTIKTKVYSPTGATVRKDEMKLEFAADDSTTVTINGTAAGADVAITATDGILLFQYPTSTAIAYASIHFKKTSIKGIATGYDALLSPVTITDSKISLKKAKP